MSDSDFEGAKQIDPDDPTWPVGDDGEALTVEEVTLAIFELAKLGLVEVQVHSDGKVYARATDTGVAAYHIEDALRHLETEVEWPE